MSEACIFVLKAIGTFDYVAANKLSYRLQRSLGSLMSKFINCESQYTQLAFLKPKRFMRKEVPLDSVYSALTEDLKREIAVMTINGNLSATVDRAELIPLLTALLEHCRIRQHLITIYHEIASHDGIQNRALLDELNLVADICERNQMATTLDILGFGVEKEIAILISLITAQTAITNFAFQDSCILLYTCKDHIKVWKNRCQEQDFPEKTTRDNDTKDTSSWLFLFGSGESKVSKEGDIWPNIIRWHIRYHENLAAKMTLYFHSILLAKETLTNEDDAEKSLWKGMAIDYYEQIGSLRKRFGALSVSLVYEVSPSIPFFPQGYVCSGTNYEPPQGVHSFPFIFCHPNQPLKDHLPNIISIIQGCRSKLEDMKSPPVQFFDSKIDSTYFMVRIDARVVFVVIFQGHMQRDTSNFINSMSHVVHSLRGTLITDQLARMDA